MNKHVMIDLETLGTAPGSVVTAIGAVEFDLDTGELGEEFSRCISIKTSLQEGFEIDGDTIEWWLKQSDAARQAMVKDPKPLSIVLSNFSSWFEQLDGGGLTGARRLVEGVWGHGSSFDIAMMDVVYHRWAGVKAPWHYRTPRDTRTLFMCTGFSIKDFPRLESEVEHDALQDARYQARAVCAAWRQLRG